MHDGAGLDVSDDATKARAKVARLTEIASGLNADELDVLVTQAERLAMGRRQYRPLDLEKDPRDWIGEAVAEALDQTQYLIFELIRLQRLPR